MSGKSAVGSGGNIKLKPETLPEGKIKTFCQNWKIIELSLFGSVLREDFLADSDLDVLVTFALNAPWTILDLVTMEAELSDLVGREVDLVEKRVIENSQNPIRRAEILNSAQVFYAQDEVDEQRNRLIAQIEGKLEQKSELQSSFTIRWRL